VPLPPHAVTTSSQLGVLIPCAAEAAGILRYRHWGADLVAVVVRQHLKKRNHGGGVFVRQDCHEYVDLSESSYVSS